MTENDRKTPVSEPESVEILNLESALAFQKESLQAVSRTFALTIPRLPNGLREAVGNGYLLCRIADTIEDDPNLPYAEKAYWQKRFLEVVEGRDSAANFACEYGSVMAASLSAGEHELIRNTPLVIRLTHSFNPAQRTALARCVRIMGTGMAEFQQQASRSGLPDGAAMDRYCYVVAGVVGEMLTSLFVDYEPRLCSKEEEMQRLAISFGQGLQMTNILKDIWTDWERGVLWLPRSCLLAHGCHPEMLHPGTEDPGFRGALLELIQMAATHLANAMQYTMKIPADQTGMRDFCLWAIAMAVLTLRRISANPHFCSGEEVKIGRDSVYRVVWMTRFLHRSNGLLDLAFRVGAKPLTVVREPAC